MASPQSPPRRQPAAESAPTTLRTFRAPSMAIALAQLKNELGPEAVILHTRTFKTGGVMGLGAKTMVEITATSDSRVPRRTAAGAARAAPAQVGQVVTRAPVQIAPERPAHQARSAAPADREGRGPDRPASAREAYGLPPGASRSASNDGLATGTDRERPRTLPAIPVEVSAPEVEADRLGRPARVRDERVRTVRPARPRELSREFDAAPAPESPGPTPRSERIARLAVHAEPRPVDSAAAGALEQELASIKRLMGQVLQVSRQAISSGARPPEGGPMRLGSMPDALFSLYLRLLDAGLSPEAADDIASRVRDELRGAELGDEEIVRQTLLRRVAAMIPVASEPPRPARAPDGRPLTLALVGPTGVGKTTTLAKLAAAYKLRHGKRVGLVTCDTYRIAAVEQLRTYATIIGLPLRVATGPDDLAVALEAQADCDMVLIDTPGRSQHDAGRLGELQALVHVARPHETHLVLSATSSDAVLERAASRFAAADPQRVLFTKLDEAVHLGPMFNVLRRINLPLSFVTTGQDVPDDIERAKAERLARLLLEGPETLAARLVSGEA